VSKTLFRKKYAKTTFWKKVCQKSTSTFYIKLDFLLEKVVFAAFFEKGGLGSSSNRT
jgi:hypothetical protein